MSNTAIEQEDGILNQQYCEYIEVLLDYLKNPSRITGEKVQQRAQAVDNAHEKCCQLKTRFGKGTKNRLKLLLCGHRQEWARILYINFKNKYLPSLKRISPFNDSLLFLVDYRDSLPKIYNEFQEYFHGAFEETFDFVIKQGGRKTYTGNVVHLIACDSPNILRGKS